MGKQRKRATVPSDSDSDDDPALLAKQLEAEQESREQPMGTESRVDAN